jgi:hypothetical protein
MHHIGYASISNRTERALAGLAPGVKTAVEWMGASGLRLNLGSTCVPCRDVGSNDDRARD